MERNGVRVKMIKTLEYAEEYEGETITAVVTRLDEGYHVLLTGGSKTHIGSVSSAGYGEDISYQFPGHRDEVVSRMWAGSLHEALSEPVVVSCGLHYDGVNKDQINGIVEECEKLLEKVIKDISATGAV